MKVRDIMTPDIEFIRAIDTVKQAAEKMSLYDIGALPVSDNGEVTGIVTDRDITVRLVADGADPMTVKVSRVMSADLVTCNEDADTEDAAALMKDHRISRLLVKNSEGRMVGIVTLSDLAMSMSYTAIGSLMNNIYGHHAPRLV